MSTYNLPELGEGLEEGEIVAWKVQEGDQIEADHAMVEVMTDKATIEVPAPVSGTVQKLHYQVGEVAQVGSPLIDIEASASAAQAKQQVEEEKVEEAPKKEATTGAELSSETPKASAAPAQTPSPSTSGASKVLASPAVRKMAREMGVDLSGIEGSGDRGRVLRKDLENAGTSGASQKTRMLHSIAREERIPFVGVRRKIAEHLSRSMYTAVHFTHHDEADFTEIMRLRKEANAYGEKHGLGRVTFLPFFIKAAIAGLKKYPILNSSLDEKTNEIVMRHEYHFGISVQTDQGLMVAVVRDCDRKDIFEIAKDIREVVERARSGKASLEDLTGSTITVTNVGNIGGLHATPVINFPEVVKGR